MNKSGIYPTCNKVLVKSDEIEEMTEGGIVIPAQVKDRHQLSSCYGIVLALGPDCFSHTVEITERWLNSKWVPFERKVVGYSEPFASVGDRIAFSMYAGRRYTGLDGIDYQLINDEDIISRIESGVVQTSIEARKAV